MNLINDILNKKTLVNFEAEKDFNNFTGAIKTLFKTNIGCTYDSNLNYTISHKNVFLISLDKNIPITTFK